MTLNNKRILFFSASFFGYQTDIQSCLESLGAEVDYYDERPANSFIVKALIRINRNLLSHYIERYYSKIIVETANNHYDYIFFIKGEAISYKNLQILKEAHPEAKLIIYHWDSIANNHNAVNHIPIFDKVFSFDKPDCERFNLTFLPLFYTKDYSHIVSNNSYKYNLLFIGTGHSDRYELVKKIESLMVGAKGYSYIYIYFPSVILYYKQKLLHRRLKNTKKKDFRFESLTKQDIIKLYANSHIIVDIQHPRQTGLTMRCLETLGASRKLITTNSHIKEYDFYNSNNILIIDRNNPEIPSDFMESPYQSVDQEIYTKYSLENWLKTILN